MTTQSHIPRPVRPPDETLSKEAYHYIEHLEEEITTLKAGMRLLLVSIEDHQHWDVGEERRWQETFLLAKVFKLYSSH